jgi:hypothetical protein
MKIYQVTPFREVGYIGIFLSRELAEEVFLSGVGSSSTDKPSALDMMDHIDELELFANIEEFEKAFEASDYE